MERLLDIFFDYQEIRDGCEAGTKIDGTVYLKRYFLAMADDPSRSAGVAHHARFSLTVHRRAGVQVYLHHILRSDADRELHDHPWNFLSLMLWRGYREETQRPCVACAAWRHDPCSYPRSLLRRKWPGMMLFRRAEHRHRVLLCGGPAWSLVFTSGKRRSWFFWRNETPFPWREFVARKCEEQAVRTRRETPR